jgi:ElaB/YqjD/DUF883 family membrane-anchored ribosome-binding protein
MTESVEDAKTAALAARDRLHGTVAIVRDRLNPKTLSREAIDKAKQTASDAASDAINAAKARPALTLGILAGAALVLFRKPVIGVVRRLTKEKDNG